MSFLECPELQIWDNAAFDTGESVDSATIKGSWMPLHSVLNSESIESEASKENQSPVLGKPPNFAKSPKPLKPLHPNGAIANSKGKPTKFVQKQSLVLPMGLASKNGSVEEVCNERKIDSEIEEIEMEINRLSARLEALRLQKAEQIGKPTERRGRIVPAKFMDQKESGKNFGSLKKSDESLWGMKKGQRRGLSMGPSEIMAGVRSRQLGKPEINSIPPIESRRKSCFLKPQEIDEAKGAKLQRRGLSMGPSEIVAGVRSRQLGKQEITPVQPIQSRRKSCFWKLPEIDEAKVTKERGKSLSPSPKFQKSFSRTQALKKSATTVGSKKPLKKEDVLISTIHPKNLFKDGEKSIPGKKTFKSGRVVPSRYNQSTGNSAMRKRSLPETEKDDGKRCDKKRASSVGRSRGTLPESCPSQGPQGTENRIKKRWEIPCEVVVYKSMGDNSPPSIARMPDVLPSIRTVRCLNESPRDSGPAKKVVELIGKRSYFGDCEEVVEPSVCQALSFAEEDEEN